ncbi:MAG: hypothetical protein HY269_05845 [Deltaproteobacteria bacterium]|nr:hypothetical protein [Deltaproteobacteria bacterium]
MQLMRLFRFFRFFGAQSRRAKVKKDLKDTLFVEKQKAAHQGGQADYWLKRDLQAAEREKRNPS